MELAASKVFATGDFPTLHIFVGMVAAQHSRILIPNSSLTLTAVSSNTSALDVISVKFARGSLTSYTTRSVERIALRYSNYRRLTFNRHKLTYESLNAALKCMFPDAFREKPDIVKKIRLSYTDSDGDLVNLSSDADLAMALYFATGKHRTVHISFAVQENRTPGSPLPGLSPMEDDHMYSPPSG